MSKVSAADYELLIQRDPLFLSSLFKEINPYLMRFCMANGIVDEKADEVIHETWEKFFSRIDQFAGRSQIRTFVCGILVNKIREHRRANKRFIELDEKFDSLTSPFTPDGWWAQPPEDPQHLLELKQSGSLIDRCLAQLPDQLRSAFLLRELEEESTQNICNILEVSVSHLGVLVFRAKSQLRKCLENRSNEKGRP